MLEDVRAANADMDQATALRTFQPYKASPVLVHCSAGVGRTGTFMVIDWALQLLETTGKFNVEETIKKLRQDRVSIVQTFEQYEFVHAAIRRHAELKGKSITVEGEYLLWCAWRAKFLVASQQTCLGPPVRSSI